MVRRRRGYGGGSGRYGGYDDGYGSPWPEYVPVAERRAKADAQIAALSKKGRKLAPVRLAGRTIATTFWGKAWCDNLESYAELANRLERGRSYVRHGSVIDLALARGQVDALVQGTSLYTVKITVRPVTPARWRALVDACAGGIDSLVELLRGRLSSAVMQRVTRHGDGLFPAPSEITFRCSCPDGVSLCKHVGAALYGVGARLDAQPELLFALRGVDPADLVTAAVAGGALGRGAGASPKAAHAQGDDALGGADLGALFGIELDAADASAAGAPSSGTPKTASAKRKAASPASTTGAARRTQRVASATPAPRAKEAARASGSAKQATSPAAAKRRAAAKRTPKG